MRVKPEGQVAEQGDHGSCFFADDIWGLGTSNAALVSVTVVLLRRAHCDVLLCHTYDYYRNYRRKPLGVK